MRFLVALMLLATPLALASHSASPCSAEVTTISAGVETLYLVRHTTTNEVWLYEEANGHEGLQRGGYLSFEDQGWPFTPRDNWCWDREIATGEQIADPDFLVYSGR